MINEKNNVQSSQLSPNQEVDYGNDNSTNSTIIDSGEQSSSASQSEVNTNTSQSTAITSATTNVKPKLPKLNLPKFEGDVTKWNTFWDSYESTIHKNDGITKVDKFNYLSSLL